MIKGLKNMLSEDNGNLSTLRCVLFFSVFVVLPAFIALCFYNEKIHALFAQLLMFISGLSAAKVVQKPLEENVVTPIGPTGELVGFTPAPETIEKPSPDEAVEIDKVGSVSVYRVPHGIEFTAGMEIDADGSPHAYAPAHSGLPALDALANAGGPGNWYGIATDEHGVPYVQSTDMPAPGFYISTTSLQNPNYKKGDPRRYTDSESVPFIVLPSIYSRWGVRLGAACKVTHTKTGKSCVGIFADIGPRSKIGEASIAMAKALGIPSSARFGGEERHIIKYEVFS